MAGPGSKGIDPQGVLIGLSGGVDSAVAALLLKEQGYRVVAVTLALWNDPEVHGERNCCSQEAVHKARAVAAQLRIPHLRIDASDVFRRLVVDYFVDEYGGGRTPNPCAKCNARVRFAKMLQIAQKLGLDRIATGHYARLTGEMQTLTRGVDRWKDQSYVLAEVPPHLLRHVLFPLGGLEKREVRELAVAAGLASSGATESQEICFIPDDDHARFLRERLGERPGAIVDDGGTELGMHRGTYNFTIGQRRGLRLAREKPTYVVELRADRREVVVGAIDEAGVGIVTITDVVRHTVVTGGDVSVQMRSSGGTVPVEAVEGGRIVLGRPAVGIAPGQTAVIYDGEHVALAGTIVSTDKWSSARSKSA